MTTKGLSADSTRGDALARATFNRSRCKRMATDMCRPVMHGVAILMSSLVLGALMTVPTGAADTSAWDGDQRSAVRLIAASAIGDAGHRTLRAGVQVKLGSGWKSYWRFPGDAGVPPQFDFSASENVRTVTVLWPAPERFFEDGVSLIGYKGDVILPLRIVPKDAGKTVALRLKLTYGICEKICILMEGNGELLLPVNAKAHEDAMAAAEARVPKQVALGEGGTLAIRAVRRELGSSRPRIVVDVVAPQASSVDVFAEGPTPDWSFGRPEFIAAEADVRHFAFALPGLPPDVKLEGSQLKFTVVAGGEAIEVSTGLK